ncbi:transporter substrate-binding domain-containing protein [uncultured Cetobacterium sp.]|nr:transporter substrate-binding domain-containing protein [uncultured Cetobacterium sp.]
MDIKDEKYAIAIKKGQKELVENINKALNELKNDGTYNKLINKYFN